MRLTLEKSWKIYNGNFCREFFSIRKNGSKKCIFVAWYFRKLVWVLMGWICLLWKENVKTTVASGFLSDIWLVSFKHSIYFTGASSSFRYYLNREFPSIVKRIIFLILYMGKNIMLPIKLISYIKILLSCWIHNWKKFGLE